MEVDTLAEPIQSNVINQQETSLNSQEAIKAFEKAVEKENNGALSDAVIYYRKALRLDSNVEQLYRNKVFDELPVENRKNPKHNYHRVDEKKVKNIDVESLLESFAGLSIEPPKSNISSYGAHVDDEVSCDEIKNIDEPVSKLVFLPEETWIEVMEILAITDTPSWFNLSMSCKKFSYLGFHNSAIWRRLCCLNYPKLNYNTDEVELNGITQDQDEMVKLYDNNWKSMLFDRPFIKFQGLYISVVHYFSEGGKSEGSSAWTNPIRMITYYRYTRFYPNGEVMRLLTVDEPSKVVPHFHKDWHRDGYLKNVFQGKWETSFDGIITIESEGSVPRYKFIEELQIKHSGQRRHHKLHWIASYSLNKEDGERGDFSMRNEKPFAFSRVKSYNEIAL